MSLDEADTEALLREAPNAYRTQINDLLLAALAETLCEWNATDAVLIDLEGHGREKLFEDLAISRTVGWFTSVFPVAITLPRTTSRGDAINSIKEQLRAIPKKGMGYGLLRYLGEPEIAERMRTHASPPVIFNYLGQLDQSLPEGSMFAIAGESAGPARGSANKRSHELDVNARVVGGRLHVSWTYSTARYRKATIERLARAYIAALQALIQHCLSPEAVRCTPSDFPLASLNQAELDAIVGERGNIEDIYPLAPLQQGLMFHSLYAPESGVYCNQFSCALVGELDIEAFVQAWHRLVARHPVLRTAFLSEGREKPLQLVCREVELPIERLDWRGLPTDEQPRRWQEYLAADRRRGFDFDRAPLMRLALIQCAQDRDYFLWTHHHVVLDGWCTSLIFKEVFAVYEALRRGEEAKPIRSRLYHDYIAWLQAQSLSGAEAYWREALRGFSAATPLGIDRPALGGPAGNEYGEHSFMLSPANASNLDGFVKRHQLTVNTLVQGAWALPLSRYSGERDVVFGITVSGRPAELAGVDQMVGLFINTVPLRVRLRPEVPLRDWLHALLQQNLELRRYAYTPLAQVQGWSEAPRGQPLFETLLVFENYPVDWTIEDQAATLGVRDVAFAEQANYPLAITAARIPGKGLVLRLDYQRDRFEDAAIVRIAEHFQRLLEGIVADAEGRLSELPMLSEAERYQLLVEWNAIEAEYPRDACLHQLFEAQVARTPRRWRRYSKTSNSPMRSSMPKPTGWRTTCGPWAWGRMFWSVSVWSARWRWS